jgi:DnaB-like helicase N terminal domain/AAA domain
MSPRTKTQDNVAPPLPHSLEAERAVLGAVLLDNAALPAATAQLRPGDLYLPQHIHILEAMIAMDVNGVAIDTVTLVEHLRTADKLEAAGGAAYLSQLPDGLPRVTNVPHYARIVRGKAQLRRVIHSASAIQEQAFGAGEDADSILDRAGKTFDELRTSSTASADLFDTAQEFKDAPPLRSLIKNFIQADVCNLIGGLPGAGKTLILMSVTKALLTGNPLFGFFTVTSPLDRVMYLIPECSRSPFYHRVKLFGLEPFIENGRLLVRTLTKGPKIDLDDSRLLRVVKDACVFIDTAARFGSGSENDASDVANGLAKDIFGLLAAGAAAVVGAHHSPKSFEKENYIGLENCLRGSGDFGAFVGAGVGIRQIDAAQNIIHIEDIKARDTEPFAPFQVIGRPYLDTEGDFRIHRKPGECEKLSAYLDFTERNQGGAPRHARESRAASVALYEQWLQENPELTSSDAAARFVALGLHVTANTVRKYKQELRR